MTALIVAVLIKVWLSLRIKLRPGVDFIVRVRIVDITTDPVTAAVIIDLVIVVGGRVGVTSVVVLIAGHAADKSADNGGADDSTDVMAVIVISTSICIVTTTTAMMIAGDIGKDAGAALGNPDVLAFWIVTPSLVQNARSVRYLMDELRLLQRSSPAFIIFMIPRMTLYRGLGHHWSGCGDVYPRPQQRKNGVAGNQIAPHKRS